MKAEKSNQSYRAAVMFWVATAMAFLSYVGTTLWTITRSSIWFDEAYSAYIIRFGYGGIAHYTAVDVHPPLYYWVLKIWQYVFGSSELALRSLSLVFGCVALVFAFLIVRRWFGRRAALISLWLLALSPMMVRYSQEARMYTMAVAVVFAATYVLTIALVTKKKIAWVLYALLIAVGMLTHYFTALAWIAHWIWRAVTTYKKKPLAWLMSLCGEYWLSSYILAIILFLPWLPYMMTQLFGIQSSGFWIGPVGVDTIINYLTNFLFYEEHGSIRGWSVATLLFLVASSIFLVQKAYAHMGRIQRKRYLLIIILAFVPVLGLLLVSLPPFKPSFVERYLLPSYAFLAITLGIALANVHVTKLFRGTYSIILVLSLIAGIGSVHHFGNFNKNTSGEIKTRQLIQAVVDRSEPGEPIIVASSGLFYEAIFYATPEHPVLFIDEKLPLRYGSEKMLKDHDKFKIKDINAFVRQHDTVWYVGTLDSPYSTWKKKQTVILHGDIYSDQTFTAAEYETR